jgi:serine/threonine-protein kinase
MPGERSKVRNQGAQLMPPGTIIAEKYVVEEVLGVGAMGFVVSATHKLIGQRVAIKFIKATYIDSEDALARFRREARALVAVQSENIVRVFDYGTLPDESPYLVMEYLTGRDLQEELRDRRTLPIEQTAEIVLQACEGLMAVHARGIVHRDIKPANLFLTRRTSGKLLVKIVDFGISKSTRMTEEELSLTRGSLGSPHYMSPEQLRNSRLVDARSDVWSLGVTLHRALTGGLPFAGENVATLFSSVLSSEPRRLRDENLALPAELEAIVSRCLAKNPDERYASVQDLADALAPFAMPSDRARLSSPDRFGASALPQGDPLHESTAQAHVTPAAGEATEELWKPKAVLAAAIAIPLALVFLGLKLTPATSKPPSDVLSSAATDPIVVTDLPMPKTTSAEAAASYQAALQAVRDASIAQAGMEFRRAAAIDPTMAAAQLRSGLYADWPMSEETRKSLRAAMSLRVSLSDRDRALLTAVEPLYLPPRPDLVEARRRLTALVAARPRDAELLLLSVFLFSQDLSRGEIESTADRLLSLDPKCAAAYWLKAAAALGWDADAVGRAVDRCLDIAPAAASCLRVGARVKDDQGDCAGLEADAERMVAMEDESYRAHDLLSRALFAEGRSIEVVRESLARKWRATDERVRAATESFDEALLDAALGDFGGAVKNARTLEKLAEDSSNEHDRMRAATLLVALNTEMGDTVGAAQVADAYLRRTAHLPPLGSLDDDPRPFLYGAAARGGARPLAERDAARAEWVELWTRQLPEHARPLLWVEGFALPAATRDEAVSALTLLPAYSPMPTLLIDGHSTLPAQAHVHFLAGHAREALPELRAVAGSCHMLADPLGFMRAREELGEALEATGDTSGACAVYAWVLDRWSNAKRSAVVSAATTHAKALGCPR